MAMALSTRCKRAASASLVAVAAIGAAPVATAGAGCTQEDMAALILVLPSRAGPIMVEVAGMPRAGARQFELSALRRDPATPPRDLARASLHRDGRDEFLRGTLRLRRVEPGVGAAGDYDFRRADGKALRGRFDAHWTSARAECG